MTTRKTSRPLLAVAAAVAVALVAVGCGDDHSDSAGGNATDAAFINDMTSHHEGAIEMAELARQMAEHPEIRELADAIVSAQKSEIADMSQMRDDMQSMHDDATHNGHMDMSEHEMGMDMDMAALERAKPFDRAFIDAMIPHHKGAIAMAKKLLADGDHPELRKMAQAMIDAQGKEITQMQTWHKRWYGAGGDGMDMGG